MSDETARINEVVNRHAPRINSILKNSARSRNHTRTGKLVRGMNTKVRRDGDDPWGITTSMKRYGYILNSGVKAREITRNGFRYYTKGFNASNWISNALEQAVPPLADELQKVSADITVNSMKF